MARGWGMSYHSVILLVQRHPHTNDGSRNVRNSIGTTTYDTVTVAAMFWSRLVRLVPLAHHYLLDHLVPRVFEVHAIFNHLNHCQCSGSRFIFTIPIPPHRNLGGERFFTHGDERVVAPFFNILRVSNLTASGNHPFDFISGNRRVVGKKTPPQ